MRRMLSRKVAILSAAARGPTAARRGPKTTTRTERGGLLNEDRSARRDRPGETRVAATPETVKKLVAGKHAVMVQSGAGVPASVTDAAYTRRRRRDRRAAGALGADLVLKVRTPIDARAAR